MLGRIIEFYFVGIISLFPVMNPFSTIPLLLALTAHMEMVERERIVRRASRNVAVILLISLVLGNVILAFFGISLPALRTAGGLILMVIGMRMLFPEAEGETAAARAGRERVDIALIPLALPSLSGPGSIAVIISWAAQIQEQTKITDQILGYLIGTASILTAVAAVWVVLHFGERIARRLGPEGLESIKRFMGFLLVCIGVQFVATGIKDFIAAT